MRVCVRAYDYVSQFGMRDSTECVFRCSFSCVCARANVHVCMYVRVRVRACVRTCVRGRRGDVSARVCVMCMCE